jgi:hypothetical protein
VALGRSAAGDYNDNKRRAGRGLSALRWSDSVWRRGGWEAVTLLQCGQREAEGRGGGEMAASDRDEREIEMPSDAKCWPLYWLARLVTGRMSARY